MNTTLPQTGEVFDFRYRIVCRLGYGSDGYLFGATDLDTGKRVAIKCWNGPHAEQALAAAQHFVRTAHQFQLFDNPNIIEVFAAEPGHTVSYCVMDWLEGMTLARRIMRKRPSPLSDVFNIVVPCMRAVGEAHAAGIIHGDVRPGHIFVCHATKHRPAIARIFDFGRPPAGLPSIPNVARALNAEAYQYSTPEQLLGEPLDARSDMYAFGIMLFEMLAGERPYVAEGSDELAEKIKAGAPKLLAVSAPSIPVRLAHVIERAMAVDPAHRYSSMSEMLDALQAFHPHASQSALPAVSVPVPKATALAIRGMTGARSAPPPPPTKRVISSKPAEIEDITTTSASWEMTEPLQLGRYQYELFKRIGWKRGTVWAVALATAIVAALYTQPTAAPPGALPPTNAPGGRDYAGAAPDYAFDPNSCSDPIGATDPNCAHLIPPIQVPAVIAPVVPIKPSVYLDPLSPRVTTTMPDASPQPSAAGAPARLRRAPAARAAKSTRSAVAGSPSPKPRANQIEKKPAAKRSRNTEAPHSNDPFERLDNMTLQ